jgi:CoB--CoM heterodisulfide reductase subunit B
MDRIKYAVFWGCQIPARLPFMEKSTRLALDALGIKHTDLEGFTCCPEKTLVKNYRQSHWVLAAARNLAVAEKEGLDILTPCNGCSGTLKTVAAMLKNDAELRSIVSEALSQVGMEYKGSARVKHLLEVLHDEAGPGKIKSAVVKPFSGMRIAVHPGCHMNRPSPAAGFDDPLHPVKFDALVEALGAECVDYHTKMMCCGGALNHAGEAEDSMALTRKKLLELQGLGADAITLFCPACFIQYDQKQYMAQRRGDRLHIPVLTYPELLGLAAGVEPAGLGLAGHRVDLAGFFRAWDDRLINYSEVKKHLDLASVKRCYQCGACVSDCPTAEITDEFGPNELIGQLLDGKIEELVNSKAIWYCVECHTCYEMCPEKFGMEKVFSALKHLSLERGAMPPSVKGGIDVFLKSGRLGEPDERARKKLGLKPLPPGGGEELARLLEWSKSRD